MPNNNTEVVTFKKYSAGEAGASGVNLSYATIPLSDGIDEEDQIIVIRKFDLALVNELVNTKPTALEIETLYTLPRSTDSGSPMYTLDKINKKIVFSAVAADYVWEHGEHHSRGADLQLPYVDYNNDEIIIARKTQANLTVVTWVSGAKVTANALNTQNDQLIQLMQELRSKVLNPIELDYSRDSALGLCTLDANGVIPLSRIPTQLGGQGSLALDLSTKDIEELQDVDITEATLAAGHVLQWNPASGTAGEWVNDVPLKYAVDYSSASELDVLRWDGSGWELASLNLGDLGDVSTSGQGEASIVFYNTATNSWTVGGQLWDDASYTTLTDNHILTWNTTNNRWEAKVHPFYTYATFDLSTASVFEMNDVGFFGDNTASDINDTDILAWKQGEWQPKSIDSWDLNNFWYGDEDAPASSFKYSGGAEGPGMAKPFGNGFYKSGWIPYWDDRLPQKDDAGVPNGSFHVGPMFSGQYNPDTGADWVNLHQAQNHWVIKWKVEAGSDSHWDVGKLNLNHLGDVQARYQPSNDEPNNGDILLYDADESIWKVAPGPTDPNDLPAGAAGQYKTNFNFNLTGFNSDSPIYDPDIIPPLYWEMYTNPYTKIKINKWQLFTNSDCEIMLEMYQVPISKWDTGVYHPTTNPTGGWKRMDKGGEIVAHSSGEWRANGVQVLGWGMKNANYQKKKQMSSPNMDYEELAQDVHCVIVPKWIYMPGTTSPTQVSLVVTWDLVEV